MTLIKYIFLLSLAKRLFYIENNLKIFTLTLIYIFFMVFNIFNKQSAKNESFSIETTLNKFPFFKTAKLSKLLKLVSRS